MLRDLRISGFRGLREFAMYGLGRVNLLVGTNNCGKTSVLEAIHILSTPGNPLPLLHAQVRRGELINSKFGRQIDVGHLVHGHELAEGSEFLVRGDSTDGESKLTARFTARKLSGKQSDEEHEDDGEFATMRMLAPMWLELHWLGPPAASQTRVAISRSGGVRERQLEFPGAVGRATSFITTEGLTRDDIVFMFERVVLTPDEQTVVQALQTIEPAIERIATVGAYAKLSLQSARGGLAMMVAGRRIPIGSMGDGIWRLLGIALALVQSRGGVLLIDEIDTGLHYSVLVDMWRLVFETARNLDVQVFATTHSRDCYEALAAVTEPDRTEISLQRIERGKVDAVAFSELEIRQAAERGLEVR